MGCCCSNEKQTISTPQGSFKINGVGVQVTSTRIKNQDLEATLPEAHAIPLDRLATSRNSDRSLEKATYITTVQEIKVVVQNEALDENISTFNGKETSQTAKTESMAKKNKDKDEPSITQKDKSGSNFVKRLSSRRKRSSRKRIARPGFTEDKEPEIGCLTYDVVEVLPSTDTWKRLSIGDTFWEGKRDLITDFSRMRVMDKYALNVS